ncbi:MAG: U32 family peptidase [Proteobacteria bacterium]|nr:U32 family peptidase [Pseudomonadota bacterium]
MKILSPLDSKEEVGELIQAGADEFFCGLLEETWHTKYPVISINRRPAGKGHFRSFADLKEAVMMAQDHHVPVYFTVNEHYYIDEQYDLVIDYVKKAVDAGVAGIILADYGFLAILKKMNLPVKLQIGTGGTVFNSQAAKFHQKTGASGITLPRHLTIDEIRKIVQNCPGIEFSVFIINSRCVNVDGFCTFEHGLSDQSCFPLYRNACMLPYHVSLYPQANPEERDMGEIVREHRFLERQHIWETVHVDDHPCGACALYEFREIGIHGIKIVGRGNPLERKVKDVRFLRAVLDLLEKDSPSQFEFMRSVKELYQKTYSRTCRIHMCYYPEVMKTPA